jgi:hypothetical protein
LSNGCCLLDNWWERSSDDVQPVSKKYTIIVTVFLITMVVLAAIFYDWFKWMGLSILRFEDLAASVFFVTSRHL